MKIVTIVLFLLAPVMAAAQDMSEAEMQNMMQLMQKMQECMAKVDQSELESLAQRSEEFEGELKALCDQGKKAEAQKMAIAYGKEMMKNESLKKMRKCAEITKGLVPESSIPSMEEKYDYSARDVCGK